MPCHPSIRSCQVSDRLASTQFRMTQTKSYSGLSSRKETRNPYLPLIMTARKRLPPFQYKIPARASLASLGNPFPKKTKLLHRKHLRFKKIVFICNGLRKSNHWPKRCFSFLAGRRGYQAIVEQERGEAGAYMKTYSVYRVDYQSNKTERIGRLKDRRMGERHNNAADMLRLAQSLYPHSAIGSHIFVIRERAPGLPG